MTRHHLMSSVKNEAIYLLEWVAHHKALGFDEIFIATNDSNDGTAPLLRKLDTNGFVKFSRNKCPPDKIPQHEGYIVLRDRFAVDECDWLMILDVDEFLFVEGEDGTVGSLTAQAPSDVDIIALNPLNFGTAPAPRQGEMVTKRFQYRLPDKDGSNRSIKSITRNPSRFKGAHNHHLTQPNPAQPLLVQRADGSTFTIAEKTKLWTVLRNTPIENVSHDLAFYNHYSIKSRAEYIMRQHRGRGAVAATSDSKQRHTENYFFNRALADVFDVRISKYDAKTKMWLDKMLAIPSIRAAHEDVEQQFLARINGLND
ncbi:glycosyltransferase family 2 protein [Octadecabacter sp.]|nr:glycosyltransferase family 2 protein [Octadecabacter sp.]